MLHRHIKSIALLSLLIGGMLFSPITTAAPVTDLIPLIKIDAGGTDTLEVGDLFYAEDYSSFLAGNLTDVQVKYLKSSQQLILEASPNASGLYLIPFEFQGIKYEIPLKVKFRQWQTLQYRPASQPEVLTLIGTFNEWDRSTMPLIDSDKDGTYSIRFLIAPGRYEYKFFQDSLEFHDPLNPNKITNPYGDYNSILIVDPLSSEQKHLRLLAVGEDKGSFTFHYDNENGNYSLIPDDIIALGNNLSLTDAHINILDECTFRISTHGKVFDGETVLRVAINENGTATNFHTLHLLDGKQREDFVWSDAIIYSLMIDRFADGDSTNNRKVIDAPMPDLVNYYGGDLQGVLDKMDEGYFDSLGTNTLWISPVNQNPHHSEVSNGRTFSAYHGYWPNHPRQVDDRFGDLAMLQGLVRKAHSANHKVLMDFVANHTHESHPFYQDHPEWFSNLYLPDGKMNVGFWDQHRLTTWFDPFLPSFDYQNSDAAINAMTDNALWWLKTLNIDGFRHDAVKHIPNNFWRTLTRKIRKNHDAPRDRRSFQIGETFGGYELIGDYVSNGQLDGQFNFNLFFTARYVFLDSAASFISLDDELKRTHEIYGVNHLMGNLMDSHDQIRFMAFADRDILLSTENPNALAWTNPPQVDHPESYQRARLYLSYLLTIPGIPVIYYGDEIGLTGTGDPDNRRPMKFGKALDKHQREMLEAVRELIHLRKSHSALRRGDFEPLYVDNDIYAYLRSDAEERILTVLNKAKTAKKIDLQLPAIYCVSTAKSLTSDFVIDVSKNSFAFTIPAQSAAFFSIK